MTQPCGCCSTPAAAAATHPGNRPWLPAIEYRLGTFATFREAILDELAGTPELAGLRSRVSDDYGIAAVEMWSAVADVLTFYTERIANEAFIRTATLRDSVLRLVRVLDYHLAPGAAATTAVAFTLEKRAAALIPARTRIQSVPGEGETPQKYETLEPLRAAAHLNSLRLFGAPAVGDPLGHGTTRAFAAPDPAAVAAVAGLAGAQKVILYAPMAAEILTVRDVSVSDDRVAVTWRDPIDGYSFVDAASGYDASTMAFRLGRTFRAFGVDAPARVVATARKVATDPTSAFLVEADTDFTFAAPVDTLDLDARYPGLRTGSRLLVVAGSNPPVTALVSVDAVGEGRATRQASWTATGTAIVTVVPAVSASVTVLTVTGAGMLAGRDVRDVVIHELLGEPLRFWESEHPDVVATGTVYVPGRRAGWSSIEIGRSIERGAYTEGSVLELADLPAGRRVIALDGGGGTPVPGSVVAATLVGQDLELGPTPADAATLVKLALDPGHAVRQTVLVSEELSWPRGQQGTALELTVTIGPVPTQAISMAPTYPDGTMGWIDDLAASLQAAIRAAVPGSPTFAAAMAWSIGGAIVVAAGVPGDAVRFGPSERDAQTVAFLGIDPPRARYYDGVLSGPLGGLVGGSVDGWVTVRRGIEPAHERHVVTGLAPIPDVPTLAVKLSMGLGAWGQARDDGRILILPPIRVLEPRSFLRLDLDTATPLALDAASAVLLGNVAQASHGETIRDEVLGDGDASTVFQQFPLRKSPVTHVPAPVPGGIASSLSVLVNGARWTEVPTLYGAGPTDEVYVSRLADDGTRTILAGDGVSGARLPTGRANVVASYRQGLGLAGRVRARTLTTLLDRPTGVKAATNPTPADGGADPESLARARETAPGTVRTFGRAISLRDFEDTSLVAGEVSKARADWIWTGRRRVVHVTVAGQGGATFSPAGLARLAATLDAERDPNQPLRIGNYGRVAVIVTGTVIVDDRHVAETVLAAARSALLDALSFERRGFADAVDLSDLYAVLQDVTGVLAVDIDRLDLKSTDAAFRAARGVDDTKGQPQPRLLMLPARPGGVPGVILPAEMAWVEVPAFDVVLRSRGGIDQ